MTNTKTTLRIIVIIAVLCVFATMAFAIEQGTEGDKKEPNQKETGSHAHGGGTGTNKVSDAPASQTSTGKSRVGTEGKDAAEEASAGQGGGGGSSTPEVNAPSAIAEAPGLAATVPEYTQGVGVEPTLNLRTSILKSEDANRPISDLLSELVEENNPIRASKLIMTILLRKEQALPVLKEALRTGSYATKCTVLSMFQKDLLWAETSAEITAIIGDPNTPEKVLCRAIAAAAAMNIEPAAAIISPLINKENEDVRQVAILALGELKYVGAKNDLLNVLNDPSPRIAVAAAESLGKLGDTNGYSIASKYLDSSDWFIRKLAAEALGSIGTDEALYKLNAHLVSEMSPMARAETEIAINRISMNRMAKPERLSHMQQLLDSENRFVSRWAHKQMLKEFPDECIPIFRERSLKSPGQLREAAETHLLLGEEHKEEGYTHE